MFFRTLLHSPLSKIIIITTIIVTIKIITLKKYMFVNRIKILLGYEIELEDLALWNYHLWLLLFKNNSFVIQAICIYESGMFH